MILWHKIVFALGYLEFSYLVEGFVSREQLHNGIGNKYCVNMNKGTSSDTVGGSSVNTCLDISELPGDPSLVLVTNLDLGEKKLDVMKKCSKAISEATGKPEAYIGVSITDNASVLFGYVQSLYIYCIHTVYLIPQGIICSRVLYHATTKARLFMLQVMTLSNCDFFLLFKSRSI